jgi:tryptophan 2,3-dioxygenase
MSRAIEAGMPTDLAGTMTYATYLQLDTLLTCQRTLSDPPHHDELLFIVVHQTTELWFKLLVHELEAATRALGEGDAALALKILARVKNIQRQLFDQWNVLETLTPSEYTQFRGVLGSSSGFQSVQYRSVEFLLGNKDPQMVAYHRHDPAAVAALEARLAAPSLYDVALRWLASQGVPVPEDVLTRDVREPHRAHPGVVEAFRAVYADPDRWWAAYNLAEKLVDVEENFSLWRFRHMKVVQRIIGFKTGTGGSSGVPFLARVVDHSFFPELWQVRTSL